MSTAAITPGDDAITLDRKVPAHGGLNLRLLRIEVRRLLRNRRTLIFATIMPLAFFLLFSSGSAGRIGRGDYNAYTMINFALYGALVAACAIGASVSIERAQGWSRQLRLTPLTGRAYIATKLLTALVGSLAPVVILFIAGALRHSSLPTDAWVTSFLLTWLMGGLFASLGLFVGYVVPTENGMQILGPLLAILAFGGGLFVPYDVLSPTMQTVARFTPMWGAGEIARWPLMGGSFEIGWLVSLVGWIGAFFLGATYFFRRDTKRV